MFAVSKEKIPGIEKIIGDCIPGDLQGILIEQYFQETSLYLIFLFY